MKCTGPVLLTLLLAGFSAFAAPETTGIYSSFYFGKSGDIAGAEMFITQGNSGFFGTIQCSEGAPGDPLLVPIAVTGTQLLFSLPENTLTGCRSGTYKGELSDDGLKLTHKRTKWTATLKRSKSFWGK